MRFLILRVARLSVGQINILYVSRGMHKCMQCVSFVRAHNDSLFVLVIIAFLNHSLRACEFELCEGAAH